MEEIILNVHMHTRYSDGFGSHADVAQAALKVGLDAIIVTDHNVYVHDLDGYYQKGDRKVLLLVGEEIHDRVRQPQKSHLLVFGAGRELTQYSNNPQQLIDQVNAAGGMCFLAHPFERAMPSFHEPDISWENWGVTGFTGLELWNGFSELKEVAHTKLAAILYALLPSHLAHRPPLRTVNKWDELNLSGQRYVAIAGSDAHALPMSLGPLHRTIFPYEFHFKSVNNHLLTSSSLTGNLPEDRRLIYTALKNGNSYIGYDLPAPTRGFRFTGHGQDQTANMGDELIFTGGITFQIRLPGECECNLLRNGQIIKTWHNQELCTYLASQPGTYRVECYIHFAGIRRAWIFSNPIYVRMPNK